jgi:hypothetical protein
MFGSFLVVDFVERGELASFLFAGYGYHADSFPPFFWASSGSALGGAIAAYFSASNCRRVCAVASTVALILLTLIVGGAIALAGLIDLDPY